MCRSHRGQQLTHYCEKTETFACQNYLESLPEDVKSSYVPTEVVVQAYKSKLFPVVQKLERYLKRLQDSHQNISIIQSQLRETGPTTIQEIQDQFAKFKAIFEERQKFLLKNVDEFVSNLHSIFISYKN